MNRVIKPWMLVVVGILFNILSAVITHYFIGINNRQLNALEMQADQHDTLIDSQWRTRTEIKRQREFLLLLLSQDENDRTPVIRSIIRDQLEQTIERQKLSALVISKSATIDFDTIETISAEATRSIINSINDTYLEKLELVQRIQPLQEKNSLLFSVAIFLQLMGLILVLSKDIVR